jgi:hypothetical protein
VRGGAWNNNNQNTRAAYRNNNNPNNRNNNIGFRVAEPLSMGYRKCHSLYGAMAEGREMYPGVAGPAPDRPGSPDGPSNNDRLALR